MEARKLRLVVALSQLMMTYVCFAQTAAAGPKIAFYFVEIGSEEIRQYKKDKGTYSQWIVRNVDQAYLLENYEILGDPFLTDDDIEKYCWANHTIFLNANGVRRWNHVGVVPFLVVVDGKPCYGAVVRNPVSSAPPPRLPEFWPFVADGRLLTRCCAYPSNEEPPTDVRSNPRVKEALRSVGKLVENCE